LVSSNKNQFRSHLKINTTKLNQNAIFLFTIDTTCDTIFLHFSLSPLGAWLWFPLTLTQFPEVVSLDLHLVL
ncbi:unnamed protein product, partial [Tenebrio molitor]